MSPESTKAAIADTQRACAVLCAASLSACEWAQGRLGNAHTYLYGAMFADFVMEAEREIGAGVKMENGKVVPARDWIVDLFFDDWFRPLKKQNRGEEFLLEVKYKLRRVLESHPAPPIESEDRTNARGPQSSPEATE